MSLNGVSINESESRLLEPRLRYEWEPRLAQELSSAWVCYSWPYPIKTTMDCVSTNSQGVRLWKLSSSTGNKESEGIKITEFWRLLLFDSKIIKVIQTLLFDKWSVTKKKGHYKKEKKTNNPASPKNGFVPGGNHLVLMCSFSLHQSLHPQLLLGQKSLRSQ